MARYLAYLHGQVRELLTHYGTIDYTVLRLSPTGRATPERLVRRRHKGRDGLELRRAACDGAGATARDRRAMTGYEIRRLSSRPRSGTSSKLGSTGCRWSVRGLPDPPTAAGRATSPATQRRLQIRGRCWCRMLVDGAVRRRQDMLLNVGPTGPRQPRPATPSRTLGRYRRRGWRCTSDRCTAPGRPVHPAAGRPATPCAGNRLYLHLLAWPFRHVHLPEWPTSIEYAQFLQRCVGD